MNCLGTAALSTQSTDGGKEEPQKEESTRAQPGVYADADVRNPKEDANGPKETARPRPLLLQSHKQEVLWSCLCRISNDACASLPCCG